MSGQSKIGWLGAVGHAASTCYFSFDTQARCLKLSSGLPTREQLIGGKMLLDVRSTLLEMLASIEAAILERERSG